MKHLGTTPPFRGPDGEIRPNSIAEIAFLLLGGFAQWVMIRGENINNPVLILLHGGPGFPEMRLFRTFNAPLEKLFTVVYWEQRGTDKSFNRRMPKSSLTVEQHISDLDELVDLVLRRFGKQKVAIYGHSWGSLLGVLYAARHPEKVSVYIGTGQIGDWPASERMSYDYTLTEAGRRGQNQALKELRALGPPPHSYWQMVTQRKWLTRYAGVLRGMSSWKFFRITCGGPESSLFDLPHIVLGMILTPKAMWDEISPMNLEVLAPELKVPVFFLIGRHDHVVPPEASAAYFEKLKAPAKEFVWFEESGHEPPAEEPSKFHKIMEERVRPLAT
jgi:pimeloyl-ACP methyl ester carboxylesterase